MQLGGWLATTSAIKVRHDGEVSRKVHGLGLGAARIEWSCSLWMFRVDGMWLRTCSYLPGSRERRRDYHESRVGRNGRHDEQTSKQAGSTGAIIRGDINLLT